MSVPGLPGADGGGTRSRACVAGRAQKLASQIVHAGRGRRLLRRAARVVRLLLYGGLLSGDLQYVSAVDPAPFGLVCRP